MTITRSWERNEELQGVRTADKPNATQELRAVDTSERQDVDVPLQESGSIGHSGPINSMVGGLSVKEDKNGIIIISIMYGGLSKIFLGHDQEREVNVDRNDGSAYIYNEDMGTATARIPKDVIDSLPDSGAVKTILDSVYNVVEANSARDGKKTITRTVMFGKIPQQREFEVSWDSSLSAIDKLMEKLDE